MQIANNIIRHFVWLDHNDLAILCCQSSLNIFKPKSDKALAMFDHNRGDIRVGKQPEHVAPVAIETRTNFFNDIDNHQLVAYGVLC